MTLVHTAPTEWKTGSSFRCPLVNFYYTSGLRKIQPHPFHNQVAHFRGAKSKSKINIESCYQTKPFDTTFVPGSSSGSQILVNSIGTRLYIINPIA